MFTFFYCSIKSQLRHKMMYRRFTYIKERICGGAIYTPKIILFFMFVALYWLKTSIETHKLKFNSIWTLTLNEIDVDLMSMGWKNTLCTKKIILEIRVCFAPKIRS